MFIPTLPISNQSTTVANLSIHNHPHLAIINLSNDYNKLTQIGMYCMI